MTIVFALTVLFGTQTLGEAENAASGSRDDFGYDPKADFIAYDANYRELKRKVDSQWDALKNELIAEERKGRATHCARQIADETKWLIHSTAQFDRAADRLALLKQVLQAEQDPHSGEQLAADGSFGCCTNEWFLKLNHTTDELITMGLKWQEPKYPLRLLNGSKVRISCGPIWTRC